MCAQSRGMAIAVWQVDVEELIDDSFIVVNDKRAALQFGWRRHQERQPLELF